MADKIFGKETVASMNEVRDAANEVNNILKNFDVSKLSSGMKDIADKSKGMSDSLKESNKYSTVNKDLAKDQSKAAALGVKYATSRNIVSKAFRGIQIKMLKSQDEFTEGLKESVDVYGEMKSAASGIVDALGPVDDAFGNIGQTIGNALTNPLAAIMGLFAVFEGQTKALAAQFGAMGVTDFRSELTSANQEFVKLGFSSEEAQQSVSALANNFGMSVGEAAKLSGNVAGLAKASGMTVDESAKLIGLFTETQGLTGQQAEDLLLGTRQLAKANGVAPDKVLSDIASDTETFARFSKDGGKNLLRAAVQARKLGIDLASVAKSADSLLDFQGSLNAEIEASILLGREVNLQKARELSLADDIEGLQQEILKVVGSEAEFNKMNRIQKDALAKAVGLEASELAKLVSKQGEQASLQGEINDLTAENEISEDALAATEKLMNDFKFIGMTLAENIGPFISQIAAGIGSFVEYLAESPNLLAVITGLLAGLAVKSMITAAAGIFTAFAQIPFGLGIPLAIGAIATMKSMVAGSKSVAQAKEGGITTQEGMINLHPQEAIIPIEKLGGMIADAMKPMAEENRRMREQNETLIAETKKIGTRTADAIGAIG